MEITKNPLEEVIGEISEELAKQIKRQAGKIVLCEGTDKFGKKHIELRHGRDIQEHGFESVTDFVRQVCSQFTEIRQGEHRSLLLVKINNPHEIVFIRLEPSEEKDYYSVGSAGYFRDNYVQKKTLLWQKSAPLD